jgi:hypothetical protein
MMLSWFNRFMASALTTLLFVVVVLFAASQTFLDGQYIKTQLKDQNAYNRLSTAISSDIAKNADDVTTPQNQVTSQLQTIITPQILQQRLTKTIDEVQAYYQDKGPVPTLDVSDLVDKAQTAGLPAPDDSKLQGPIKLTAATKAKSFSTAAKAIGAAMLALILLLIIGIFVIARKRHNYKTFTAVLTSLGIMLSVTGAALLIVPHIFNKLYTFNPSTNPFGALAHDLALGILHDFALHLLIPGLAILAIGILIRVLIGRAAKRAKADTDAAPTAEPDVPAPRPLPNTPPPTDAPESAPLATPPMPRTRGPKPPRKIQG